jgi:dTDP-4-amino-4,6-dideoxygalactose transaminase
MAVASCDGVGAEPTRLVRAHWRSFREVPEWVQADGRDIFYTYQGRNAIALLCSFAGLGAGDEVLAPAYNCGAEIDPFLRSGARVVLYDVNRDLSIDVDRVCRSITGSTRVVYVTHFFGIGQPLESLASVCQMRGVVLVEDCAQALFSAMPDSRLGSAGDAAIYSFVKTLPTPDGGALVVDRELSRGEDQRISPPVTATIRGCLPLVKKRLMNSERFGGVVRGALSLVRGSRQRTSNDGGLGVRYPPMLQSNRFVESRSRWMMSRVSRGVLQSADIPTIVETRRRNFNFLLQALDGTPGFSIVIADLPAGVCPMAFPFVVADRSYWCSQLEDSGILIQGWPGYYPGFDWDAYPQACHLKDNLLTLPVHQDLTPAHMEFIAKCVKRVARSCGTVPRADRHR